jgi:hypothetical protein
MMLSARNFSLFYCLINDFSSTTAIPNLQLLVPLGDTMLKLQQPASHPAPAGGSALGPMRLKARRGFA